MFKRQTGGSPKIRGTYLGRPIIRVIVFVDLCGLPPCFGKLPTLNPKPYITPIYYVSFYFFSIISIVLWPTVNPNGNTEAPKPETGPSKTKLLGGSALHQDLGLRVEGSGASKGT